MKIKKEIKYIVIFVSLIGFLALAEDVFTNEIMKGDIIGYNFIKTHLIRDSLTPLFKLITFFGGPICLIGLTLLLFIIFFHKKLKWVIVANLGIVTMLNQLLKLLLHRPRPDDLKIINEVGYSFPSGHSMLSMAFYGYLIYLIYCKVNNKFLKYGLIVLLSSLIILIGISRIYLGVHYTSDVLAGFLISIAYLMIYIEYTNKILLKGEINEK